jgi:DNA-directed RNA polymerase subunit RPC12/RpoP
VLPIRCPRCGSRDIRTSHSRTVPERIATFFGHLQLRCKNCDERFADAIWDLRNLLYAKCPQCYNTELCFWKPEQYHAPARWRFLLAIGARPRRCERCRRNFVSFRPCKIRYQRRKVRAQAMNGQTEGSE